jgi:hypothetical protein
MSGMFAHRASKLAFRLHTVSQIGISFLKVLFIFPIEQFAKNSSLFYPSVHVPHASTLTLTSA